MSKLFFIVNIVCVIFLSDGSVFPAALQEKPGKTPIVITSQTLTADNKNSTAVFEGDVVAKTDDVTIHSDKMIVFYDSGESRVKKIHALGRVKVLKDEKALFSDEAIYLQGDETILFTGNPKVVDGENVISGSQITFHIKDERVEVRSSRVILQNKQGLN